MSEENIISKEVSAIASALKPKRVKRNKMAYFTGALIIMGLLLVVQTVQLSLLKAQIANGSFGVKAATTPSAAGGDLPNMAGGC